MPRIRRKKLQFTEESLNEFAQECYNDQRNLKDMVIALFNKWKATIPTGDPIAINLIGKELVSLLNTMDKVHNQKHVILKIQKEMVLFKQKAIDAKTKESDNESKGELSETDADDVLRTVNQLIKNKKK